MKFKTTPFSQAIDVIKAIHGEWRFGLMAFDRKDGTNHAWPVETNYGTIQEQIENFDQFKAKGLEPFILVGCGDGQGFANKNIVATWAIALDFDHGKPDMLKNNSLVAPSLNIETSQGRYQCVWILDAECPNETALRLLRGMALRLGSDFAHAKTSQLLRLPGFIHRRHGTESRLLPDSQPDKAYSVDFLTAAFDVDLMCRAAKQVLTRFDSSLVIKRSGNEKAHVIEDLRAAIPYLKGYADDYISWISTIMAFVPIGAEGEDLARQFSKLSSKHDETEFGKKWVSVQQSPGSVSTIFVRAQQAGWSNPGFRKRDQESVSVLTERDFGRMVAAEMRDGFAVVEGYSDKKAPHVFLQWDGAAYSPMNKISYRAKVEVVGSKVLAGLIESKVLDTKTAVTWMHKLGSNRNLNDVCEHTAEAMVLDAQNRFANGYPYIGVANGVLNLVSQELIPACYKPISFRTAPVVFDPNAEAPLFKNTLQEIFEGDKDMIRYFVQLMGYIALGKPKEHVLLLFIGAGSNGKSLLSDVLQALLGPYAVNMPTKTIMTQSNVNDGSTPALAQLVGRRLAIVSEPNRKHTLDSGLVKQMTGDRAMNVRELYASNMDMLNEFVLLMVSNVLPVVRSDDTGLWRRIRILPFNRRFEEDEIDRDLGDKLFKEAPGILNILLLGIQDYLENGLITPNKVTAANNEEKSAVDPVEVFLKDTLVAEDGCEMPLKTLYDILYLDWEKLNKRFEHLTKQELSKRLVLKGYQKRLKSHLPYFLGLRPVADS